MLGDGLIRLHEVLDEFVSVLVGVGWSVIKRKRAHTIRNHLMRAEATLKSERVTFKDLKLYGVFD